jgi:hypothetical protein
MANAPAPAAAPHDQAEAFAARGYLAIPDVLDAAQVARARQQLAADRARFPGSWATYGQSADGGPVGESGRWQQHSLLLDSDAFDWAVDLILTHPRVMPLIRHLVGPEAWPAWMPKSF